MSVQNEIFLVKCSKGQEKAESRMGGHCCGAGPGMTLVAVDLPVRPVAPLSNLNGFAALGT